MKVDSIELLRIFDLEIRKTCKNKRKILTFERNKMQNIIDIKNSIENNSYIPGKYNVFFIRDPKYRIVMSSSVRDKIVNHYFAKNVLIPKLDKYLDNRSVATRCGLGTDYGIKLVKKYIEKNKKYGNFYVLKLDIKKYFYNIDHNVLKELLIDKLSDDEFLLISKIIDCTNSNYINEEIIKNKKTEIIKRPKDSEQILDLPIYQRNKGLSLGAVTSQYLSVFYLYKLIHYIIHDLHLKYMVHYVDDIVIFHYDKNYLYECLKKIEEMLNNYFKLNLNKKKTKIVSIKEGFTFLGYTFKVINNKTIVGIRKSTLSKVKRRVKEINYLYNNNYISFEKVFSSLNTYLYSFKYSKTLKISRIINNNFRVN